MKTAIVIIVILIAAAGTAFYFGWVRVEPEVFGLAYSTITGTIDHPIESGNIYWVWQKLVPKTFHLYTVQKKPAKASARITASLPKSDVLTEYGRFDLTIDAHVRYRIDFEAAEFLLNRGIFDNFNDYFAENISTLGDETVSSFIIENLARYSGGRIAFDYGIFDHLNQELENKLLDYAHSYSLKDVNVSLVFAEVPQIESYINALKSYNKYMGNFYDLKEEEMRLESENLKKQKEEELEIGRLRKYGEVISEYPDILKYLYIEKLGDKIEVIVLPQDESTGFPKMLEHLEESREEEFQPGEAAPSVPEKSFAPEVPEAKTDITEEPPKETVPQPKPEQKEKFDLMKYLKFWELLKKDKN
jgi:hypothetical protein